MTHTLPVRQSCYTSIARLQPQSTATALLGLQKQPSGCFLHNFTQKLSSKNAMSKYISPALAIVQLVSVSMGWRWTRQYAPILALFVLESTFTFKLSLLLLMIDLTQVKTKQSLSNREISILWTFCPRTPSIPVLHADTGMDQKRLSITTYQGKYSICCTYSKVFRRGRSSNIVYVHI